MVGRRGSVSLRLPPAVPPQPRRSYNSSIKKVPSNGVFAEKGREDKGSAVGSGASVRRRLSTTSSGSLVALLEEKRFSPFVAAGAKRGGSRTDCSQCIFCSALTTEPVAVGLRLGAA